MRTSIKSVLANDAEVAARLVPAFAEVTRALTATLILTRFCRLFPLLLDHRVLLLLFFQMRSPKSAHTRPLPLFPYLHSLRTIHAYDKAMRDLTLCGQNWLVFFFLVLCNLIFAFPSSFHCGNGKILI